MIASLLEFSLRQRILVLGLACLLSVAGVFAFQSIPIDAYPDVTNIQVQVLTEAPGLSPIEVERFITYPLELQMTGLPGLAEIRSLSKFALSQITVVFNDDVDMYFARQLVLERIMAAKERLPEGLEPVMAPVTTGLGEVFRSMRHSVADAEHFRAIEAYSNAKIRFQSFFMLMTIQPCFFASSWSAWVKDPTLVSGSPCAGPYAYSRFASSCRTSIDRRAPSPAFTYSSICWSPVELPNAA